MTLSSVDAGSLVGERLGKYHLLALIAIGGTAEIYLARIAGEAGFEKYVVVKCLLDHLADDTDFVRMFLDEARLCAQLDHSNIVQTLELGQHEGRYYMVMEHLAGMSMAQLARKTHERTPEGVIPTRIVLGLAAQACGGLHYAHQRTGSDGNQLNVVHRDVSPQNLVVTFEGMLKIVDFGIAKANLRQTHTRTGTIKGKFAYMSPEQCLAEPIDRRTDVFALGTVVHELLTARRLFKRASTYETYQAILKGNAPPPSRYNQTVDDELDRVVLRALAYNRDDRYESTEAFGEAMLGWLHTHGQSISATDVSRYVEKVCAPEIEDHAAHMRELISGHKPSTSESLRWDSAMEEEVKSLAAAPSPSFSASEAAYELEVPSGDFGEDEASSQRMAQPVLKSSGQHREEDFAGDTQIELDPMERVAAMEAEAAVIEAEERARDNAGGRGARGAGRGEAGGPRVLVGAGAGAARDAGAGAAGRSSDAGSAASRLPGGPASASNSAAAGRSSDAGSAASRLPGGPPRNHMGDVDSSGPTRAVDTAGSGQPMDPSSSGPTRAVETAGSVASRLPGGPPGPNYPPASLRPRGGPVGSSSPAPADRPGSGRRRANEQTAPEMAIGGAPAHDQLTMPASEMIRPEGEGRAGSSPIEVYETPLPGSAGQMWGDDSAAVLRHGRSPMPGPAPARPDLGPGSLPSMRPMLHRPPPGLGLGPGPGPAPSPAPREGMSIWLLAVAFLVSAGVGLGLTVLIGSLIA
ncbi:MAG TPA: protein kinase [Kofleriaceae bacterium]|nr:protein kinase [Kofleriaceae bacterium]